MECVQKGKYLSNIDPVTFSNEIRNNPQYSGWFNSIQNWASDIKTSSGKSFFPSEIDFLQRLRYELNSTPHSPVVEIQNNSTIELMNQNNDMLIRNLLDNDLIHTYAGIVNETHLRTKLDLMNVTLTDSNFNETLRLLMSLAVC